MSQEKETLKVDPVAEEMKLLKERADMMGIKYSPNISIETLRERVNEKLQPKGSSKPAGAGKLTDKQKRRKDQMKLIRVRISCMNPSKNDLPGGIYTVSNSLVGTVSKYVPHNTDERGYHIPQILLNSLKRRRFRHSQESIDPVTKMPTYTHQHLPEFNIQILPDLTQKELDDLAKTNAALAEIR